MKRLERQWMSVIRQITGEQHKLIPGVVHTESGRRACSIIGVADDGHIRIVSLARGEHVPKRFPIASVEVSGDIADALEEMAEKTKMIRGRWEPVMREHLGGRASDQTLRDLLRGGAAEEESIGA